LSGSELPDHVRARLDFILEFLIAGRRQAAQMPARRKRNAALAALLKRIAAFQTAIAALTQLPTWALIDDPETDDLTPSGVFLTLPHRLRVVADMARAASREWARVSNDSDRSVLVLRSLASCADELADTLLLLDFASQGDVLKYLPWSQDYLMNTLPEVVNVSIRLSASVETALQIGRETRGQRNPRS
jgi:hypothetical protein